ncbi:zinc ribbon domain-containing protein [Citrobacter sedlakii]|uniref:zinc ribbon domain-containing protein n=1 Tax=Citrobacter sedlakii TaxID=67826 RepID=UPI002B228E56|nr:zinc ribbon domain-containing protein [Citrobacter sedlakii]MEB0951246.1 zinc ribbon domain-containing protein [Citrobacter sedlakii]
MELRCPDCQNPLERNGETAHCATCNVDYALAVLCPDCHKPLQILKACGAVDYFCQNGHGLISKKRVEFALTRT